MLAIAYKPTRRQRDDGESNMTFMGLVGMIDPPRPEARTAIQTCEQAGIRAVMITGDHPLTAQAVARELGLLKTGRVITGAWNWRLWTTINSSVKSKVSKSMRAFLRPTNYGSLPPCKKKGTWSP